MSIDRPVYEAFLPHHTASKHRVMAITRRPAHTQLHALATVPDAVTARRVADALNSRLLGRRNHAERLTTALVGLPDSVQAAIQQLPIDPDRRLGRPPLASHLYTTPIDGFLLFPTNSCTPGQCSLCADCANDCRDCAVCDSDQPCSDCLPPELTPRTASVLAAAGAFLADNCYDIAHQITTYPAAAQDRDSLMLPDVMRNQDADFLRRMARAFDDLAGDLEDGVAPRPLSMAEQIALDLMLEHADVMHDDEPELLHILTNELPETPYDFDFPDVYDVLLEDTDHVGFLEPVDIPAAPGTLNDLFDPFRVSEDRDPDRGYRR